MSKIYYWRGIVGNQEALETYSETINKIIAGEYQSADLKKMSGHSVYSARINDTDRLLFATITVNGETCLLLLEVLLNHDYQKSRFLNNPHLLKRHLQEQETLLASTLPEETLFNLDVGQEDFPSIGNPDMYQCAEYYNEQLIVLSDEQNECLIASLPAVISGGPGSGKSCVAFSLLCQKSEEPFRYDEEGNPSPGRMLYVTGSDPLVRNFGHFYQENISPVALNEAHFKTYVELLLASAPELAQLEEVGASDFSEWLEGHKKESKKTNKTLLNVINHIPADQVYQEFRIISGYDQDTYLGLGERQSLLDDHNARIWVLDAYQAYQSHLAENDQYDQAFYEFGKAGLGGLEYDLIVVDEAQDLSLNQLRNLKSLAHSENFLSDHNICYCMDSHQSLLDEQSKRPYLQQLYFESGRTLEFLQLSQIYRCPPTVVKMANVVIQFKYRLTGGLSDKKESDSIHSAPDKAEKKGVSDVLWYEKLDPKEEAFYQAIAQQHDFGIVVFSEESRKEAQAKYNSPLVFTPDEIKGLEFSKVMVIDPFEGAICKVANHELNDPHQETFFKKGPTNRAKKGQGEGRYGPYFNQVFTAFTRATEQLILIQESRHDNKFLVQGLKAVLPAAVSRDQLLEKSSLSPITRVTTAEEWHDKAKELYFKGKLKQAEDTLVSKGLLKDNQSSESQFAQWDNERVEKEKIKLTTTSLKKHQDGPLKPTTPATQKSALSNTNQNPTEPQNSSAPAPKKKPQKKRKEKGGRGRRKNARGGRNPTQATFPNKAKQEKTLKKYKRKYAPNYVYQAAQHDDFKAIELFAVFKMDLTEEVDGISPLSIAAEKGCFRSAGVLIEKGVDVNLVNKEGETPLFYSAQEGHIEIVQLLLKAKADVNSAPKNGRTPFLMAVHNEHAKVVELLLSNKDVEVNQPDNYGITPLLMAAQKGYIEVVKLLLNNEDVKVNQPDNNGMTPLSMAAKMGHIEVVKLLLSANAKVNLATKDGSTPLLIAAHNGHIEVVELLLKAKADVNQPGNDGATPLFIAVGKGHIEIVKLLFKVKADVNLATNDGTTPLLAAAQEGHIEVVELLLKAKADVNLASSDGLTSLFLAAHKGDSKVVKLLLKANADVNLALNDGATSLWVAAQEGHIEVVELLLKANADVNLALNDGATPLWVAAKEGHSKVVKLLLKANADVNLAIYDGTTPLSMAVQKGHVEVVKLLLNNEDVKVNQPNNHGTTSLLIAALNGHIEIVQLLLNANAKVNLATEDGKTPLLVAALNGHVEVVQLLFENGAMLRRATNANIFPEEMCLTMSLPMQLADALIKPSITTIEIIECMKSAYENNQTLNFCFEKGDALTSALEYILQHVDHTEICQYFIDCLQGENRCNQVLRFLADLKLSKRIEDSIKRNIYHVLTADIFSKATNPKFLDDHISFFSEFTENETFQSPLKMEP